MKAVVQSKYLELYKELDYWKRGKVIMPSLQLFSLAVVAALIGVSVNRLITHFKKYIL